jgi:hypothetical protein
MRQIKALHGMLRTATDTLSALPQARAQRLAAAALSLLCDCAPPPVLLSQLTPAERAELGLLQHVEVGESLACADVTAAVTADVTAVHTTDSSSTGASAAAGRAARTSSTAEGQSGTSVQQEHPQHQQQQQQQQPEAVLLTAAHFLALLDPLALWLKPWLSGAACVTEIGDSSSDASNGTGALTADTALLSLIGLCECSGATR